MVEPPHCLSRTSRLPSLVAGLCATALMAGGSSAAGAQGQTSTGVVLDPSGARVPGCLVVSRDPGTGAETRSTPLGEGRYVIPVAKSVAKSVANQGTEVTVECRGFEPVRRTLRAEEAGREVVFRLRLADVIESVTVPSAASGLDLAQSGNQESQLLTASTIAVLPVLDQDYVGFMSRFLDPSVTGTQGATLVVNGVEGGNFYQAPSAIETLEVNQDQYSPAFASAGRGRLSLVTNAGTERLHGSAAFALREHALDATPDFSPVKPPENREDYQATATGPVGKSRRLHFAVSAQLKKDDAYAIVNAVEPSGPLVEASPAPFYRDKAGGSVYFDPSAGKQWIVGLGRTDEVHHNGSVGGLFLPSISDFTEYTGHFLDLQWTDLISGHTLNQVRLALGQEGLLTHDRSDGAQIDVAGAFVSGSAQADHSYKQYVVSGNDLVSTGTKNHTLRLGLDIPELSVHTDNDETNREGTYYYPSLQAYQAGRPDLFAVSQGDGVVRFTSVSAAVFAEDTRRIGQHLSLMAGARYYFQNVYRNRPTHVSPRAEIAVSFGRQSRSVLRVGAGTFYDRILTTDRAQLLQFNGRRLRRYLLTNPSPPVSTTDGIPPSFLVTSPRATLPYVAQWSGAFEQQLTSRATLSVQGTMSAGIHQLRMTDLNAPLSPTYLEPPDPSLGQILSSESEGHSRSQAMDIMFKLSASRGVTQQLRYRISKAQDDTDGLLYVPADSYAPEQDASPASYDQRQNLSLLSTWPLLWKLSFGTVLQAGSGLPYTELLGQDANRDGTLNDRPPGIRRNTGRGAAQVTLDTRLGRDVHFGRRKDATALALSVSGFNLLNHANYSSYQGVVTSPAFGRPVTAGAPRQLQLNAALSF